MTDAPILVQPSATELAAAVEGNLEALFRAMVTALDGEIEETDRLGRHLASPTNPMFKGVWRTRLTPEEAGAAIDETIAWFAMRQAPFFFWWTGAETTPFDIGERLVARGLIDMAEMSTQMAPGMYSSQIGAPGMVADLAHLDDSLLQRPPKGFTIEEVQDEAALDAFCRVLVAGFGMPEQMAQGWAQASQGAGIGDTPWQLYLGRLDGEPVATNMGFNGAGVASFYGLAVVPAARRKGIGAAITVAPLLAARNAGYRHAVLFSTDEAVPLYEHLGFRDCGVRINRYLWRPGE